MAGDMKGDAEMNKEQMEKEHRYQVEDDVRTLTKAEEVKKDAKRYKEACEMMNSQMATMTQAMSKKMMK